MKLFWILTLLTNLYKHFWTILDWLYPPSCGGCGQLGFRWCEICGNNTKKVFHPFCNLCGQPLRDGKLCFRCVKTPLTITRIRSWVIFDGEIRNALHKLKYRKDVALGEAFSSYLFDLVKKMNGDVQVVLPVPLGQTRQKERGYNQADLLAKPLADTMKTPYIPKALIRIRDTQSQVQLDRLQRQKNVAGAFASASLDVKDKSILVVDDVTTSGATLNACADALFHAGASKVYGLTLARAEKISVN